jgi:hypothetical protein
MQKNQMSHINILRLGRVFDGESLWFLFTSSTQYLTITSSISIFIVSKDMIRFPLEITVLRFCGLSKWRIAFYLTVIFTSHWVWNQRRHQKVRPDEVLSVSKCP